MGLFCGAAFAAEKPNVLVILTDDQGSRDLACYGAKDLATPNIDTIASTGVKLTHFYAAAPVCCPSRAGFMTGKYPWEVGVPSNIGLSAEGLPSKVKTIAEYFKDAGYATAHLGKWHLGHHRETLPNGQGFDFSFGHHGGCIDNFSHYFYWDGPNKHDLWENGKEVFHGGHFFPHLMRDKALQFTARVDQPFFMYYALNLPHYPYQAPDKWVDYYQKMEMPRKLYAAAISAIDESIGQLFEGLKKQGKFENTVIVFMSDHGHSTEVRAFGGGGWAGEFRGAKFSLFEGGIRVPGLISYPKLLPQNVTRKQMAVSCDWLPTLLDLCEVNYDASSFRGKSQKAMLISDTPTPHTSFVWQSGQQKAVRMGDWKLLENPHDTGVKYGGKIKGVVLYDLKKDPGEKTDVSKQHALIVEQMKALLP